MDGLAAGGGKPNDDACLAGLGTFWSQKLPGPDEASASASALKPPIAYWYFWFLSKDRISIGARAAQSLKDLLLLPAAVGTYTVPLSAPLATTAQPLVVINSTVCGGMRLTWSIRMA